MNTLQSGFLERVRAGLSQDRDLSRLGGWVKNNTRNPKKPDKKWSFKDHEFQENIVNDTANDMVVKKCAQVGLSEISLRMALGLISIHPNSTAIYTLPTGGFATVFVKSRIDPVIKASPMLSQLVDKEIDNTELKKIGGSFLYIRGTFTQTAAISVPADILIHDEIDFSDQLTLTSFTSRLGHVKEENIVRRRFSTPTVSGYGVSLLFDDSTQQWYAVKCQRCETWQVPNFILDTVLPGYEGKILDLEREDLADPRYRFDEAYLKCPGCGKELTISNLSDHNRRQWVAAKPGQTRSGYQVQPFDVPTINPVSRTLRSLDDFERKVDWVNFKVGRDYQDSDTSFVKEAVDKAFCLGWVQPYPGAASNTIIGVDVGKTSWITVAKKNELGGLDIIHYERVKLTSKEALPSRVKQLFEWYGGLMLVIDAMPEWTQALAVIETVPQGKGFACYYRSRRGLKMSFIDPDEENKVVSVDRSAIISDTAKKVNEGMHRFCKAADAATYRSHLDNIKRVNRKDSRGQDEQSWINTGPDHYGHTLFFASAAANLLNYKPKLIVVPALPLPGKARIGGHSKRARAEENTGRILSFHDRI